MHSELKHLAQTICVSEHFSECYIPADAIVAELAAQIRHVFVSKPCTRLIEFESSLTSRT